MDVGLAGAVDPAGAVYGSTLMGVAAEVEGAVEGAVPCAVPPESVDAPAFPPPTLPWELFGNLGPPPKAV